MELPNVGLNVDDTAVLNSHGLAKLAESIEKQVKSQVIETLSSPVLDQMTSGEITKVEVVRGLLQRSPKRSLRPEGPPRIGVAKMCKRVTNVKSRLQSASRV